MTKLWSRQAVGEMGKNGTPPLPPPLKVIKKISPFKLVFKPIIYRSANTSNSLKITSALQTITHILCKLTLEKA